VNLEISLLPTARIISILTRASRFLHLQRARSHLQRRITHVQRRISHLQDDNHTCNHQVDHYNDEYHTCNDKSRHYNATFHTYNDEYHVCNEKFTTAMRDLPRAMTHIVSTMQYFTSTMLNSHLQ
jgi:predicted  nucleic acid-binding Zn-ribbon protein